MHRINVNCEKAVQSIIIHITYKEEESSMNFKFSKWQACGNDFVLVNAFTQKNISEIESSVIKICDRHFGVGADGVIFILPSDSADFRMKIINNDGSEAEMCGNGIRCFAKAVYRAGLTDKKKFTVETGAGLIIPEIKDDGTVHVDMGEPILEGDAIPVAGFGSGRVVDEDIEVDGGIYKMTCVSMGNPHCVVFVDDIAKVDLEHIGPKFETHGAFPKKTNTEFVQVKDRSHVRMRVWERGAGITLACGTGSCATAAACILNGKTGRKVEVELDGGALNIEWAANNHIYMTGPATEVFTAEWLDK